ncbi:hypothetical protein CQY23_19795 [Mycobacterium celatum]|uniref:Uncharacterized protein n=1 Tax=Mycobacterium celatum TaxID=28045 RepID=A0A2G5PBN1_MYCCE|nr:hypothetical protein CQY23_19795 [Mycobacterium celatum]
MEVLLQVLHRRGTLLSPQQLHWFAKSKMAQLSSAGPPVSVANFGYDLAAFCKVCEGAACLNRFR